MMMCKLCPLGQFASGNYSASCYSATPGFYVDVLGAHEMKPCPAGRYGNQQGETSSNCSGICRPGYICPAASQHEDEIGCGGTAVFCPAGSGQVQICPSGHYTVGGDNDLTRTHCVPCPPGYECQNGMQFPCPVGTIAPNPGTVACQKCRVGHVVTYDVQLELNQTRTASDMLRISCTACPAGFYNPASALDCIPCTVGYYSNISGATICNICPPGTSSSQLLGSSTCLTCATGSFADGKIALYQCISCAPGTMALQNGSTSCQSW